MNPNQREKFISTLLSRMVTVTENHTFVCTYCECEGTALDPLKLPHEDGCQAYASMKSIRELPELLDYIDMEKYT